MLTNQKAWYYKLLMIKSEIGDSSPTLRNALAELECAMSAEDMAHVREIVKSAVVKGD